MIFYDLSDNSPSEKEWVFAVRIHPKSHVVKWHCPECGRAAEYPAGALNVTVEGGSAFPDFLGCGAYPLLIVSQRVVSVFEDAGISCFCKYLVGVSGIQDSRAELDMAPTYFRIEISGECMIDFAGSGTIVKNFCGRCGEISTQPSVIRDFAIVDGSWDGCDLFRDRRYYPRVSFCTARVVDLARKQQLTNVRFRQMP